MNIDQRAEQFERHRPRLQAVCYRMLGSTAEAEDAVQETWLRLNRSDASAIDNLGGWLTTVAAQVCLNVLRSRSQRREDPLEDRWPDLAVTLVEDGPEHEALTADAVGLTLMTVLQTLSPAERLAFVLHDMFAFPYVEIAPILDRTPTAARQLASRARRRVQQTPLPDPDVAAQRQVANAFLAASRTGDFAGLIAVLAPDVVLRVDHGRPAGGPAAEVRGAVAHQATLFGRQGDAGRSSRPALVDGLAGSVTFTDGLVSAVLRFFLVDGRIAAIEILADPGRLARLDLSG